jgi:hypothetical protein
MFLNFRLIYWGPHQLLIVDGNVQLSTSPASRCYQANRASASALTFLVDTSAGALEDSMATPPSPVAAPPQGDRH